MISRGKALLVPGGIAMLLALAGALGFGPCLGGAGGTLFVIDVSPSCEPLEEIPAGAILCEDSRLGTALGEAVRAGATRINLYTDGCDISGEAPEPAGVPVDVVLRPRRDDLLVLSVRAPDRIPLGTDFAVEIAVGRTRGPDRPPVTSTVTLFREGERVGSPVAVEFERGQTARVLVRDRVDREGIVQYRATIEDPVGHPDDDNGYAVARIGDRPLVLSIGGPLDVPGLVVTEYHPPTAALHPAFGVADAIVAFSDPDFVTRHAIAAAVRNGAGFVLLGGARVAGSELERILPLTDAPPQGRAALLLLDVSGSMDELIPALAEATEKLVRHFSEGDRVACVLFADRVVETFPWRRAAEARFDLRTRRGKGSTLLLPALAEAERMLGEAKGERRLFVISDGKWGDRNDPKLAQRLAGLGGIHRAALFVEGEVPAESKALFPVSLAAKDDLAAALRRLEDAAQDRTVASADAVAAPGPAWLEGAAPPSGVYHNFVRLYPRGVGEAVVLAAGGIPVVAAWRPGGKVVMSATGDVDIAALVRAVLKDTGGIRLRAWHEGGEVVAEAAGSDGAPFAFDGVSVPARPAGRDRWRATAASATRVSCGAATVLVAGERGELAGLGNRKDIAAAIAASSGGFLTEEGGRGGEEARRAAVWATLLLAALLVLASAWRRRRT